MRYPTSEKVEIIRIVEQSSLSARKTLAQIGVPRATFYRWYDQYHTGGPEALVGAGAECTCRRSSMITRATLSPRS